MKKMVSVILPTYNREKVIKRAVDSILKQTYSLFELIIVDDASEDDTESVVKQINDSRIRYFKLSTNRGPSYARNYGIKQAKYDYIAFHDSDDEWLSEKLELQMNAMKQGIGMVYCPYHYIDGDNVVNVPDESIPIEKLSGDIFDSLLESNKIGTPTILVRKECLEKMGYFNEKLLCLEDWELAIRIAKEYRIAYVEEPLVRAFYSGNSVNQRVEERLETIQYLFRKYKGIQKYKQVHMNTILSCLIDLSEEERMNWEKKLIPDFFPNKEFCDYALLLRKQINKANLDSAIQMQLTNRAKCDIFIQRHLLGKKIAIYGLGCVGITLLNLLRDRGVEIVALLDRRRLIVGDDRTISLQEIGNLSIDKIIVTVHTQYEVIVKNVANYCDAECVNVSEILEDGR